MQKTEIAVLDIQIGELTNIFKTDEHSWRIGDVARAFSTEYESAGDYSIPAADTGQDLLFNSLEVLRRFSSVSINHQRTFLVALRRVMKDNSVQVARVEVGWSKNRTRVLTVRSLGDGQHLMISV